jgi:hypothetical protein
MKYLRRFNVVVVLMMALAVTPLVKAAEDDGWIRRPSNIAQTDSSSAANKDGSVLADVADILGAVWSDILLLI